MHTLAVSGTAYVSGNATLAGALNRGIPVTKTTNFTLAATESYVMCSSLANVYVTLPAASTAVGRDVTIKAVGNPTLAGNVVSVAADVYPLAGGALGNVILTNSATGGKYARLVSNSTGWVIMEAN